MDWKNFVKAILFPHIAVLIALLPVGIGSLVYAMLFWDSTDPIRIVTYVISFYALTVWCLRFPAIIRFCKSFKSENKYAKRWLEDVHLRVKVTLIGNVLWNTAYALFQLGLGISHKSAWFYSLAGYYFSLAIMRFFLMRHTIHHQPGAKMRTELLRYRLCGWIFLIMNLALSGIMLYMIHENRMVRHHEITTITMAAYTFTSLTMSIINTVRYRKYNSPVFSASKIISLTSACVSMLTLESTMLATFSTEQMPIETQILFLALTGAAVSAFIITMAIYMIVKANRTIKNLEN